MTRIAYLGSVNQRPQQKRTPKHTPGTLVLPRDIAEVSEQEMDLMLAKQRLEIEKMNSAAVAGPFNFQIEKYDQAIGIVDKALHAVRTGDEEYLAKLAGYFTDNGQPAIGGFFGKVWKGIKKGVSKVGKGIAKGAKAVAKGIVKVATFPLRMLAKLVLEIYLPKAAPTFLYLFADEKALPDKMRIKRKKSEKFKNFVCKKIGMKEKHFMGIIRNSLTKKLRMSPESYLAKIIKGTAIKGIGAPGYDRRRMEVNQQWIKHGRISGMPIGNSYLGYVESHPDSIRESKIIASLNENAGIGVNIPKINVSSEQLEQAFETAKEGVENVKQSKGKVKKVANTLLAAGATAAMFIPGGQVVGGIIAAIQWIINKLGGKQEGVELQPEDLPNPVADAGNVFKYEDLQEDYSNLTPGQQTSIKNTAAEMIDQGYDAEAAMPRIRQKAPYLNTSQAQEIAMEVEEGYEPLTEQDAATTARTIKTAGDMNDLDYIEQTGGGARGGVCKC